MEITFDLDEIKEVSKNIISLINGYKIILFNGELGAGKTTLINAVCKELGVEEIVTSPTYAIIQEYHFEVKKTIFHMDLYRIKSNREAIDAGVEDCIMSNELCFIEWPEKAISLFPEERINIIIQTVSNSKRKLIVQLPQ